VRGGWSRPADRAPEAAVVFRETVASVPYGHFQPEDAPLIRTYACNVVLTQKAATELAAAPLVDGKVSGWLATYTTMLRAQALLSRMLKIGPKSRRPDSRRATKPLSQPSYYDLNPSPPSSKGPSGW
jgi:hypothetical protein